MKPDIHGFGELSVDCGEPVYMIADTGSIQCRTSLKSVSYLSLAVITAIIEAANSVHDADALH